ncbi:hypothetical protein BaRGS_00033132, partial [Batillaria attramentaria]
YARQNSCVLRNSAASNFTDSSGSYNKLISPLSVPQSDLLKNAARSGPCGYSGAGIVPRGGQPLAVCLGNLRDRHECPPFPKQIDSLQSQIIPDGRVKRWPDCKTSGSQISPHHAAESGIWGQGQSAPV